MGSEHVLVLVKDSIRCHDITKTRSCNICNDAFQKQK